MVATANFICCNYFCAQADQSIEQFSEKQTKKACWPESLCVLLYWDIILPSSDVSRSSIDLWSLINISALLWLTRPFVRGLTCSLCETGLMEWHTILISWAHLWWNCFEDVLIVPLRWLFWCLHGHLELGFHTKYRDLTQLINCA